MKIGSTEIALFIKAGKEQTDIEIVGVSHWWRYVECVQIVGHAVCMYTGPIFGLTIALYLMNRRCGLGRYSKRDRRLGNTICKKVFMFTQSITHTYRHTNTQYIIIYIYVNC